ncbi:MAG: ABC transporter permease subunit, partial [Sphaerochaetaceae bacterium]|nr:ABC transporter permease subunit [Sphaerochaetaceae bacterium]
TKWETIWRVMLPAASPGIVAGVILAIGRAVGETAALIYTIGSGTALATGPFESARVLAMHIFLTITEGQSIDKAFASAMVLVVLVLIINVVARLTVRRFFRHGAT